MEIVDARRELTSVELEHLDEHIAREMFESDCVEPFSTSWSSALKVQEYLLGAFDCDHELGVGAKPPAMAAFISMGLAVQATSDSIPEAISLAGLAFFRRAVVAGI